MNLFFRLLFVTLKALFGQSLGIDGVSRVRMCVWPNDLDLNIHMNNGRYLTLFDLGTLDMMIKTGLAKIALSRKWQPIVGGCMVRFRFSLTPFEKFTIVTRILCWDEKWFYVYHHMASRRGVAAVALARVIVRDRDGLIPPREVLKCLGIDTKSPCLPPQVRQWIVTDEILRAEDSD
jgi:acyl-CoA thioesterase FadM